MSLCNRIAVAVALMSAAGAAPAGVLFSDNFDAENGGSGQLNYTAFANWSVSEGAVDLIGTGFIDILPGNGLYVDLDGTASDAAVFTSDTINLPAGDFVLSFDLAGSQRGETNTVSVTFFGQALIVTLDSSAPFTTYTIPVSLAAPGADSIVFDHQGGDNFGLLLDRVEVRTIPTPSALSAFGALGLLAGRRRR